MQTWLMNHKAVILSLSVSHSEVIAYIDFQIIPEH